MTMLMFKASLMIQRAVKTVRNRSDLISGHPLFTQYATTVMRVAITSTLVIQRTKLSVIS